MKTLKEYKNRRLTISCVIANLRTLGFNMIHSTETIFGDGTNEYTYRKYKECEISISSYQYPEDNKTSYCIIEVRKYDSRFKAFKHCKSESFTLQKNAFNEVMDYILESMPHSNAA